MKLTERIKSIFRGGRKKSASEQLTLEQFLDAFGIPRGLDGSALSEATYFACLKVLSESMGKLPFRVLRRTAKDGVQEVLDHKYWRMVHTSPNRFMTATVFWTLMEFCRSHYGNAYAVIDESDPSRPQLWPLDPRQVQIYVDNALRLSDKRADVYYRYTAPNGDVEVYTSEEVLHFKSQLTLDGIVGISVREQLASTINGQIKAADMVNELYQNGMTAKGVLNYTGSLSDPLVQELIKRVNEFASNDSGGRIVPIPPGFALQPLNMKLADSQFFEIKQATALQIAAAFGVKPSQIGDYTKSSYSSSEAQQLSFLMDTLLYIVKGYGEELTCKLISEDDEKKGLRIKAQTSVLLRADSATQIDTLSKATNNFLLTPNEAREELDRPHMEGGDRLIGNGASIPITAVGSQYGASDSGKEV